MAYVTNHIAIKVFLNTFHYKKSLTRIISEVNCEHHYINS